MYFNSSRSSSDGSDVVVNADLFHELNVLKKLAAAAVEHNDFLFNTVM